MVCKPLCGTSLGAGQLAAGASSVLLAVSSSASLPLCPAPFSPGSSFAFSSLSFPGVGLVSGPDPVQYLSRGSIICSHFHMFNIHISCLLPCPIAVTGSCSLRLGLRATGIPVSAVSLLSHPVNSGGLQCRAEWLMPTPHSHLQLPPPQAGTRFRWLCPSQEEEGLYSLRSSGQ